MIGFVRGSERIGLVQMTQTLQFDDHSIKLNVGRTQIHDTNTQGLEATNDSLLKQDRFKQRIQLLSYLFTGTHKCSQLFNDARDCRAEFVSVVGKVRLIQLPQRKRDTFEKFGQFSAEWDQVRQIRLSEEWRQQLLLHKPRNVLVHLARRT